MTTVAIVGGGVIGCSLAYHLAEAGLGPVTLFERDRLGSGTTWHSAGNITWKPQGDEDGPVLYAYELIDRLERDGRQTTGWLTTGRLFLAQSEASLETYRDFHEGSLAEGLDSQWLSPTEAAAHHPLLQPNSLTGAWLNPRSGRLNPADFVAALSQAAKSLGAEIVDGARVEDLTTGGTEVSGLVVDGEHRSFDKVVVAAGLWSRSLLLPLGFPLAGWGCEHFYLIADCTPRLTRELPSFVCPDALVYGREEVGGLLFGFFDEGAKTFDPQTLPDPFSFSLLPDNWEQVTPYVEGAMRLFPTLQEAPIRKFINGPESFSPDGDPFIGTVPGIDNLFVAAVMNSHGVTIAPAVGRMITALIKEEEPPFSMAPYDPGRFGDRAHDEDWLAGEVTHTPSRFYRRVN